MRTASIDNAPNYHVSNTGTVFLDGKVLHQSNSNGYREVKINGEKSICSSVSGISVYSKS